MRKIFLVNEELFILTMSIDFSILVVCHFTIGKITEDLNAPWAVKAYRLVHKNVPADALIFEDHLGAFANQKERMAIGSCVARSFQLKFHVELPQEVKDSLREYTGTVVRALLILEFWGLSYMHDEIKGGGGGEKLG